MTMPWFRFYSEAMRDTKLRRVARKSGISFAETLGTWAVILSYASESPQRGALLLSDGNPVTLDDIEDVTGCNVSETFQQLLCNGMLTQEDTLYHVANWDKRQYASDNSTERVHKHRAKARNADETPMKRYGNVSETPPDTDTDTDTEKDSDDAVVAVDPAYGQALRAFENDISLLSGTLADDMSDMWDLLTSNGTPDWWYKAIGVSVAANSRSWRYMRGVLQKCLNEGHPPGYKRNGSSNHDAPVTPKQFTVLYPDGTSEQVNNER